MTFLPVIDHPVQHPRTDRREPAIRAIPSVGAARGCDVAHCRDNLIQFSGYDVADLFLRRYREVTGADYDPYWEIASVLEHSPSSFNDQRVSISETRLQPAVAQYT